MLTCERCTKEQTNSKSSEEKGKMRKNGSIMRIPFLRPRHCDDGGRTCGPSSSA